jgi:hypothetical protein
VKETGKREDKKINMCKREESKGKKSMWGVIMGKLKEDIPSLG